MGPATDEFVSEIYAAAAELAVVGRGYRVAACGQRTNSQGVPGDNRYAHKQMARCCDDIRNAEWNIAGRRCPRSRYMLLVGVAENLFLVAGSRAS